MNLNKARRTVSNALTALLILSFVFLLLSSVVIIKETKKFEQVVEKTKLNNSSREMNQSELDELNCVINKTLCKVHKPTPSKKKLSIARYIIDAFPENKEIALAIHLQESNLNPSAIGYNCFYDAKGNVHKERLTGVYSTHCKSGHSIYAWSVDCGLSQINHLGKKCTKDSLDIGHSLEMALNKYVKSGNSFRPWVAFTSGKYKDKLSEARLLIANLE